FTSFGRPWSPSFESSKSAAWEKRSIRANYLEGPAAAPAESTAGEAASATESSAGAEARAAGTRARRGYESLMRGARHAPNVMSKHHGIEARVIRAGVPRRGIADDARERFCPVRFHSERHCVGQEFFEGV